MRPMLRGFRAAPAFLALALPLVGFACNGPGTNPSAEAARAALQSVLDAWRAGKKPGDLATATPPIQVMDSEWTNGRKLSEFEILREEPSESDKRFAVKLVHGPTAKDAEEVVYIVLGAGPMSVFRDADYNRAMNMDNNPAPKKKRR